MSLLMRRTLTVGCAFVLFFLSNPLFAFDLVVTEREFYQLTRTCQLYYYSAMGKRLDFEAPFSNEEVANARIEAEATGGAWHYCGGLVWLNRAAVTGDPQKKKIAYEQAMLEIDFTAKKISKSNPMFMAVKVNQAKAYFLNGHKDKSKKSLESLLAEFPLMTAARIELARQLKLANQIKQAISLLEQASSKEFEISADLNYFLGVYHYHDGNFDSSFKYAQQAYKLKYPLPWLRKKLAAKGFQV